jgi:oligopeptide transport system substrate-binding protein
MEELSYRSGQLHVTYGIPISKVDTYRAHQPSDLAVDQVLASFYLFLNVTRPPLDNLKLRQALTHALDRETLCRDVTRGTYPVAHEMVPPNCGGYTSRTSVSDDFDLARRLLAEAGYPGGVGLDPIEVQCYEGDVPMRIMEAIQAVWLKELGVRITIAQIEQKTLFQNSHDKAYTIAYSGWIADYPDPLTFLGTMVTGNGNNWAGWSNKQYDALIAKAAVTADNTKRLELFQQAEAIMLGEAPLIPLYHKPQVYARSPVIHGWTTNISGFHDFSKMWLEK